MLEMGILGAIFGYGTALVAYFVIGKGLRDIEAAEAPPSARPTRLAPTDARQDLVPTSRSLNLG